MSSNAAINDKQDKTVREQDELQTQQQTTSHFFTKSRKSLHGYGSTKKKSATLKLSEVSKSENQSYETSPQNYTRTNNHQWFSKYVENVSELFKRTEKERMMNLSPKSLNPILIKETPTSGFGRFRSTSKTLASGQK